MVCKRVLLLVSSKDKGGIHMYYIPSVGSTMQERVVDFMNKYTKMNR
jgi:hypothetical protein